MKKIFLFVVFLLSIEIAYNQSFTWRASLPAISRNGYYNIALSPEITARLNKDFGGIRVFDETGNEIPYIFHREAIPTFKEIYEQFEIVEENQNDDYTEVIIKNVKASDLQNLVLQIKEQECKSRLMVVASNDKKQWIPIDTNYHFKTVNHPWLWCNSYNISDALWKNKGHFNHSEIRIFHENLKNYLFYKLRIEHYNDQKISVQNAGTYDLQKQALAYNSIPVSSIKRSNSKQQTKTDLLIRFDTLHFVDKIEFRINNTGYYDRVTNLQNRSRDTRRKPFKRRRNKYSDFIYFSFQLKSYSFNHVYLDDLYTDVLHLEILNHNDEPLQIESVKAFEQKKYLTAQLEQEKKYYIKFGSHKAEVPIYDLQDFKDNLPENITEIAPDDPIRIITDNRDSEITNIFSKKLVWIALVVVAVILLVMSVKMIRDMNARQNKN